MLPGPDAALVGVLYAVKLVRAMVLWIALYVSEKAFQDDYVQSVLLSSKPPPKLTRVMPGALAAEAAVALLLVVGVWLMQARFKTPAHAFVLDGQFMRLAASDYLLTTAVLLVVGWGAGRVVQDRTIFHYRDDGLRGIRALCTLLLGVVLVVLALPMFLLV